MYGAGTASREPLLSALRRAKALMRTPGAATRMGVNLFVPSGFHVDPSRWTPQQAAAVQSAAARHAAAVGELSGGNRAQAAQAAAAVSREAAEAVFGEQVDALLEEGVGVVSFHFGWPAARDADRLRAAGAVLIGNATSAAEAQLLESLGADAIIAQGPEAGGHRGSFLEDAGGCDSDSTAGAMCLLRAVAEAVSVPVIAAGGIMDGADVAAALVAGASAAQLGTAFLTAVECGAPPAHKRALLRRGSLAAPTVVTKGFTGKPARALSNAWTRGMGEIEAQLPNCFNGMPAGRALQGLAVREERTDIMYMWAGQGYTRSRPEAGAAELVRSLVSELRAALPTPSKL